MASSDKSALRKMSSKHTTHKKRRKESYSLYIYNVMKQVSPQSGISSSSMRVLNSVVDDLFGRIAREASRLATINNKMTVSSKEIQGAIRLLFPGELAQHAVAEGGKATTKYTKSF